GSEIIAVGPRMPGNGPGYASGGVSAGFAFGHTFGDDPLDSPAYITSAAAAPRTVVVTQSGLVVTRPGLMTDLQIPLMAGNAVPQSAAVTIAGTPQSIVPNSTFSTLAYTSRINGRGTL